MKSNSKKANNKIKDSHDSDDTIEVKPSQTQIFDTQEKQLNRMKFSKFRYNPIESVKTSLKPVRRIESKTPLKQTYKIKNASKTSDGYCPWNYHPDQDWKKALHCDNR